MNDELAAPPVERILLGVVEVDSGTLLLGDPAYCLPSVEHGKAGIDYLAIYDVGAVPAAPLGGMPVLLLGNFGGDGTFPVFGDFVDGELLSATILFIEPPEDE